MGMSWQIADSRLGSRLGKTRLPIGLPGVQLEDPVLQVQRHLATDFLDDAPQLHDLGGTARQDVRVLTVKPGWVTFSIHFAYGEEWTARSNSIRRLEGKCTQRPIFQQ